MVKRIEKDNGTVEYRNKDKLHHREDGPAVIFPNGTEIWFKNGKFHRDDGPAIIHPNGEEVWYRNGKFHRDDGPAITWSNGIKEWWLNGKPYSFKEWIKLLDISDEEKMELVLYYG